MRPYVITTDANADLPIEYTQANNIRILPLYYSFGEEIYGGDNVLPEKEFYSRMRNGQMPTTMAVNPEVAERTFRELINAGYDILHIAFSSALSGSYNVTAMVASQLMEELPEVNIKVVDSLSASAGQGMLVHKLNQLKDKGISFQELYDWAEAHKLNFCHQFTVDDLFHLHRGGRVSKATAILGTVIQIKPVLHVDNEGHLIPLSNVRGRKKALNALVDIMEKTMGNHLPENDIIFISHGDSLEDAQYVADRVKERFGINQFMISMVNPIIGAHSGPGTIALFYIGETR